MSPEIIPIPALKDNYIYVVQTQNKNYVIDPSLDEKALEIFPKNNWKIDGILLTHHHWDHVDGAEVLARKYNCPIYAHDKDGYRLPQVTHPLPTPSNTKNTFSLPELELEYFPIPGHTLGHIGFYIPSAKSFFSGDTLFSFGCGRLFEGTPEMMVNSLSKIRALPDDTLIYCGHEYTQTNIEFTLSIEPNNLEVQKKYEEVKRKREQGLSTIPTLLGDEKRMNPFLRWDEKTLKKTLGLLESSDVETFAFIRQKRNQF